VKVFIKETTVLYCRHKVTLGDQDFDFMEADVKTHPPLSSSFFETDDMFDSRFSISIKQYEVYTV